MEPEPIKAVKVALEGLGFTKIVSKQLSTENTANREMVTFTYNEFQDVHGNLRDVSTYHWYGLSKNGYGIKYHIGTKQFTAHVRKFQGMEALGFKPKCLHPVDKHCTCNTPNNNNYFRRKGADPREGEKKAMLEAAALNGEHQSKPHNPMLLGTSGPSTFL